MNCEHRERRQPRPGLRDGEAGYTLLLALFIAAVMIIAASVAVPNLIVQDRRQKEKLMIWRGDQYARAIGLYYRKTGHFPHDLDELEKDVNGLHFLRQAYKDPMNSQDGSWRLIYLGTGGQLMGSLCWHTLVEYQAAQKGLPLPVSPLRGPGVSSVIATGSGALGVGQKEAVPSCGMFGQGSSSSIHPQVITEGQMVGGNLIGVAGVVDQPSIKDYMGAGRYRYWEFIWNPQEATQKILAPPAKPKIPQPGGPGGSETSSPTGAPTSPAPPQTRNDQSQQP
jgi:type II secretory pathway pseudopilin PulG